MGEVHSLPTQGLSQLRNPVIVQSVQYDVSKQVARLCCQKQLQTVIGLSTVASA